MPRLLLIGICLASLIALSPTADAAPPEVRDPRLTLQLVADAPDIVTPIGATFDHKGRLLVIESHTHHAAANYPGPKSDRIRIVEDTNAKVEEGQAIYNRLKAKQGGAAFSKEIDYLYFDLWHYYGRTAKHGAFMGGADFVQWHGNFELLRHISRLKEIEAGHP